MGKGAPIPVQTDRAPKAVGPYSQAIRAGSLVFVSGQIPLDPASGMVIEGGIREQTERVLKNMEAILEACGMSRANVVRTDVFLRDMNDFPAMNEVYGSFFRHEPRPARQTVEVSRLPRDVLVEISCIACDPTA